MTLLVACPNCELGRQVRSEFWSADFGTNGAAIALPFLLVILASWQLSRRY